MILGMLGDFEFKMNKAEFNQVSKQIDFGWVSSDRIANYSKHQVATKPKTSLSISGNLIMKSIYTFDKLEKLGELQEPVLLNFIDTYPVLVVIKSLKKDMSRFIKTGEYMEQGFNIEIERWYK
ncbi:phage tail protein [Aliarcobacter butzleri]|uniref:phage tail protein n=1 Tax=Aliarcobacter butzleri TaxID=28197 RepID=UPI0021B61929|nr:phage tail protein [Aliarcobacter butzleri]MCT7650926.1 phage tail protein [Aliarcobacter butzleri]